MSREEQAALVLKLYELRREPAMREARAWFATRFDPVNAWEIVGLMRRGYGESERYRMVVTYWDMACSLVANGAIEPVLFHGANTEHVAVYAKLEPHLAEVREALASPRYLENLEKVVRGLADVEERLSRVRKLLKHWTAPRGPAA